MLQLAYDAKRLFTNFTGLGNYSRTLLHDLSTNFPSEAYFLFTPKVKVNTSTQFFLQNPMFHVETPPKGKKIGWRTFGIKKQLRKHKIDIFHGLSHEIPIGIHKTGISSVVTIHDLIFKHYPHQYKKTDRLVYDFKFKYACQKSDSIIAISESTKKDIIDFYGISPNKIDVVYQSCHAQFKAILPPSVIEGVVKKYNLPTQFIFYVGSIIERKNLLNIVKALKILPKNVRPHLVVVGDGGSYKKTVQDYIVKENLVNQISFIKADFKDLPALYQRASAFIYPSFYEGFGIPIIEALYSQTPVITSNISSLPEAAGKGAIQVNPDSIAEISHAIEKLLNDTLFHKELINNGLSHISKFNGDLAAAHVMNIYKKLQ